MTSGGPQALESSRLDFEERLEDMIVNDPTLIGLPIMVLGRHGDHDTTYYVCVTSPEHHRDQPWFAAHPRTTTVREDHLLPAIGQFFGERVLGPRRRFWLDRHRPAPDTGVAAERAKLATRLGQLTRAQANLLIRLENYQPTGDADIDAQWRAALQRRFADLAAEHRATTYRLTH